MFNRLIPRTFKNSDSPLTPEAPRSTTFSIHIEGTNRFLDRLVGAGLQLVSPEDYSEATMPPWSVMRARRWRTNLDTGVIARGLLMRLDGDPTSVAVFASEKGTLTSAVERAVGRLSLSSHLYLAVIADRGLERPPAYTRRFQAEIEPHAPAVVGLRSDLEVINHLKARR